MKKLFNPFIISGYEGARYFCDREQETRQLADEIVNGNNVALIATRRMGKSGLIQHYFSQPSVQRDYYTFFIDIYDTQSLRELVLKLSKEIVTRLQPYGKRTLKRFWDCVHSLQAGISFSPTGEPSFNVQLGEIQAGITTLDEIFQYFEVADRPCIVAIDEFQQINNYPETNVEATMRTYVQHCHNAQFIFASSQRHTMSSMFTNAAWLLFAQDNPHYNVHIGRFKTPSMIIADKMISGTLFEVVDEAMQTIVGHLKFAFDIHITGASTKRTEIPEYPLDAIRELLLNSIVHRDYQSPTDVQIKIFDQRIEFFNPSGLYGNITEEMLATDTYKASTRNKQIAEAFYLTKDIEKYGSGFVRIRKELLSYPQMRFFYKNEGYGFTAGFEYGNGTLSGTLNSSQVEVLKYIGINGGCNASTIIESLGIPRNTLNKIIRTLTERNLIERRGGKKKGGYWKVLGTNKID